MSRCSIGVTSSGREILIAVDAKEVRDIAREFYDFSEIDRIEAMLALEFLILRESRRVFPDPAWIAALEFFRTYVGRDLGKQRTMQLKRRLGVTSAFEARDYGQRIVHRHFRDLTV